MRRADARPVAHTSPTSANVWSGMVRNSARPVNVTSAPADSVPSSARRPPTQIVSARNSAGITAASAFHALSRRASAIGARPHLRGAFGEPSPHAVLAAEALHHPESGGDVGRDRRRVGEPLLLFGGPPVVRAPERHQHEEARGEADEDEAAEDRRRREHPRADGEERLTIAPEPAAHEVGDAAHPLRVAGGEGEERAGLDVDAAPRIEHDGVVTRRSTSHRVRV